MSLSPEEHVTGGTSATKAKTRGHLPNRLNQDYQHSFPGQLSDTMLCSVNTLDVNRLSHHQQMGKWKQTQRGLGTDYYNSAVA